MTGGTRCRAKPIARSAAACRSQERLWADSGSGHRTCRLRGRTRNQCRARPALAVTGNGPSRPVAAPSGSVRHRERNGHGMLSPDRPFFRPRKCPAWRRRPSVAGCCRVAEAGVGCCCLLSSLLSAPPRRWVLSTWPVEPPLLAAASGLTPCFPWRALTYLAHLDPVRRTRRVRVHTRSRRSEAQLRQEGSKQAMRVMLMIKGDKEPVGLDYSVWPGQTSRAGIIAE